MVVEEVCAQPIRLDDPVRIQQLSDAIRTMDPTLEVLYAPTDALLYVPEGTFYAVCMREGQTISHNHREVLANPGDLLVVPQAMAIDASQPVELIGVLAVDFHPEHFRERFLQVWGLEHLPCPGLAETRSSVDWLITPQDVRHRVTYRVVRLQDPDQTLELGGEETSLLIAIQGTFHIRGRAPAQPLLTELPERSLMLLTPAQSLQISGEGLLGVFSLVHFLAHEARRGLRRRPDEPLSPEYRPSTSVGGEENSNATEVGT